MENKSTVEVHEELALREGIIEIVIGPYETFQVVQDQRTQEFTGPARIIANQNSLINHSLDYILEVANIKGYEIKEGSVIHFMIQHLRNDLLLK